MSTPTTAPASTPAATPAPAKTQPRSTGITLVHGNGKTARVSATRRKDNTAFTRVTTYAKPDAEGKRKMLKQGATEEHTSMEVAQARVQATAKDLVKIGWELRKSGGFTRAKTDDFDAKNLPSPTDK